MIKLYNKRGVELNFAIIFAVMVGGAILILAIYAATQFVNTGSEIYNSEIAFELGNIIIPVETGLEEGKTYSFSVIDDTRIENQCSSIGVFGEQSLGVSVRNNIGKEWQKSGVPIKSVNKYVFSEKRIEGKDFNLFVKPLELPYRVGDVIVLYSRSYCFVNPPDWIVDDVSGLNAREINVTLDKRNCAKGSVSVCFNNENGCNVSVIFMADRDSNFGIVKKGTKNVEYYGPLVYGAIFSDKEIYDCQVLRMRKRASELASLYSTKANLVSGRGCSSGMEGALEAYSLELKNEQVSLSSIVSESETLGRANDKLSCELF